MSESSISETTPLILTLKFDPKTFDYFDQLRQQHFPPERNFIPAHITLFHALPSERKDRIQITLQELCSCTPIFPLVFSKLRFLGRGVAVEVSCPELIHLRQQLVKQWNGWLSRQDQQGYRPHITIQNKTTADQARQLYDQLANEWHPVSGYAEGLLLWYYRGGPWELADEFYFDHQ